MFHNNVFFLFHFYSHRKSFKPKNDTSFIPLAPKSRYQRLIGLIYYHQRITCVCEYDDRTIFKNSNPCRLRDMKQMVICRYDEEFLEKMGIPVFRPLEYI